MSPPGEPPLDPELSRRVADSRRRPETEFPAVVPVGTLQFDRTEPTAIAVTCVLAYSNGFEFFVTRVLRPDGPRFGLGAGPAPPHLRTGRAVNQSLEIGVEFADGGRFFATDTPPLDDEDATGPVLHFGGGVGSAHRSDDRWWVWPLPPSGRLDFIARLEAAERRVSMEAQLILDASQRIVRPWSSA